MRVSAASGAPVAQRLPSSRPLLWCVTAMLAATGAIAGAAGQSQLSLVLVALAGVSMILYAAALTGALTSWLTIFAMFQLLYAISGPIAALYGAGLPDIFATPYATDDVLVLQSLAMFGLTIGLGITDLLPGHGVARRAEIRTKLPLVPLGLGLVVTGALMELVNLWRVGGIAILALGKAVYQARVERLFLTLPSYELVDLGLALFGLGWALARARGAPARQLGSSLIIAVAALVPILSITVILGRRGPLIDWLAILAVGMTWGNPIRRVGWRVVLAAVIAYGFFAVVTANRIVLGLVVVTKDYTLIPRYVLKPENILNAVNPASNEFGAPFGNISEVVIRGRGEATLGMSYLTGLVLPIPRFAYPGNKPTQPGIAFRDKYFPQEAERSAIAGTAFSPILEALLNFGPVGVPVMFVCWGMLFGLIERGRWTSRRLWIPVMYLLALPLASAFHRSDFALDFGWTFLMACYSGAILCAAWFFQQISAGLSPRRSARTATSSARA